MLLIDKLRMQKDLTNTEKRIADYILQNLTTIPAINVADLAKNTYTSHSSVIRLAQKWGLTAFAIFEWRFLRLPIVTFIDRTLSMPISRFYHKTQPKKSLKKLPI